MINTVCEKLAILPFEGDPSLMYKLQYSSNILNMARWRMWEEDYIIEVEKGKFPFDSW